MHTTTIIKLAKALSTAAVVLVAVGVAVLTMVVPRVTGSVSLTVLSGSMEPTIPVGSVVFVRPVEPAAVGVGDVITFQPREGVASFVTHRVVGVSFEDERRSFTTKGDANRGEDVDPVPEGAVRGRVLFHVPVVGTVSDTVRTPMGMLGLVALPGAAYLAVEIRDAVRERRRRRNGCPAVLGEIDGAGARSPAASESGTGVVRELLLASVGTTRPGRRQLGRLVEASGATLLGSAGGRTTVMHVGLPSELDDLERGLAGWPDREVSRSGFVAVGFAVPGAAVPPTSLAPAWQGAPGGSRAPSRPAGHRSTIHV